MDFIVSFIFWYNTIIGNISICLLLYFCNRAFGTIRDRKKIVEVVFFAVLSIVFGIFVDRIGPREMSIPRILSMRYEEMEGTVQGYREGDSLIGDTVDVIDRETGKTYRFWNMSMPSGVSIGDSVKMSYLKYYRTGVCVEVNGKTIQYDMTDNHLAGIIIIIALLAAVPVYYFWNFRSGSFFRFTRDYSIHTYHDVYVKAGKILYLFMVQSAAVLFIALLGYYKGSWDWYWGFLLLADYIGIFCLSFLHQKEFVIVKDTFYYCACKKRAEGKLEEIEGVEKTEKGVIILANGKEMEIFCTSDRCRDALMEKLAPGKGRSM